MKTSTIKFYIREEPYGFLSNFWRCSQTTYDEFGYSVTCPTNEHYYQSSKAKRSDVQEWIAKAPTAKIAMTTGRSLPIDEIKENWDSIKTEIMLNGLRSKFQDETLKLLLLWTGDVILVEDSPTDMFWGGSLPGSQNMLGKLLMQVRDEIRAEINQIQSNADDFI